VNSDAERILLRAQADHGFKTVQELQTFAREWLSYVRNLPITAWSIEEDDR
jgi:hypothetical protein